MTQLSGRETIGIADDLADACHLLTMADQSNTALPVRILYNLVAAASGSQHRIAFQGSLQTVAFNVADHFNHCGDWGANAGDCFLAHVDQQLQRQNIAFTPKSPVWLKARGGP